MRRRLLMRYLAVGLAMAVTVILWPRIRRKEDIAKMVQEIPHDIQLPQPEEEGSLSLEQALLKRRSIRDYAETPLTLAHISQILWAAQGITDPRGFRTTPSAGALYPLELYLIVGQAEGLEPGVYHYAPAKHQLARVVDGDCRATLAAAALGQSFIRTSPVALVYTAIFARTTRKYGYRGNQYVYMEVGHSAQNVYLQATALGLGTVAVGAFDDSRVQAALQLPKEQQPLYIMPLGQASR